MDGQALRHKLRKAAASVVSRLVAVKADVNGLDVRTVREETQQGFFSHAAHHNAVFVGRDEDGIPRYAHSKGTAGNFRLDVKGSDKAFNFCYRGGGDRLFVFEAPVDLLSFHCLFKKAWQKQSYLSLGGVGEKALLCFLSDRPNIDRKSVV